MKWKFAFLACALHLTSVFANYSQVASLKEIEDLKLADENTLIVFDVDEVLITTEDQFMHPNADKVTLPIIRSAMGKAVTAAQQKEVEELMSLSMLLPKRVLVEKEAPKIISDLQGKNVKVIALTSCQSGPFGVIPKVERWRIDHLKSLSITFSSAFPKVERCHLMDGAEGKQAEFSFKKPQYPLFEEGILFSKGFAKGDVLKAFLEKSGYRPSKVILIDDLAGNLDSAQEAMKSMNIEFKGILYTGAKKFYKKPDHAVISYQFNHLMRTREWLNDQQVASMLKVEQELQTVPFPKTKVVP